MAEEVQMVTSKTLHKGLRVGNSKIAGRGLFAVVEIKKGEVIFQEPEEDMRKYYISLQELHALPEPEKSRCITLGYQVDSETWSKPAPEDSPDNEADLYNHSCDPNSGPQVNDPCTFIAFRDISPGEEITYDYATTNLTFWGHDSFDCHCLAAICRSTVRGTDYLLPELHARYGRHWQPYLMDRIDALSSSSSSI